MALSHKTSHRISATDIRARYLAARNQSHHYKFPLLEVMSSCLVIVSREEYINIVAGLIQLLKPQEIKTNERHQDARHIKTIDRSRTNLIPERISQIEEQQNRGTRAEYKQEVKPCLRMCFTEHG